MVFMFLPWLATVSQFNAVLSTGHTISMSRILALNPGGIGDQILFFPTLQGLRDRFSRSRIEVVVEPRSQGAYRICPWADETLLFDFKAEPSLADWMNLIGIIRDRHYDAVLSVGSSPAISLLLWMTGIPTRVGYGAWLTERFLTRSVVLDRNQYAAAMYADLLTGFDIERGNVIPTVAVRPDDSKWANQYLDQIGAKQPVILHPGASKLAEQKGIRKLYPAESWVQVIQKLSQKQPNLVFTVAQGPDDQALVTQLKQSIGEKVTFVQPPDIGKLAALISLSRLLLCVDSAPMHLGVGTGTPLVALFGPTLPGKLLPVDPRFIALVSPERTQVDRILVDSIVQAANKLLCVSSVS